MLDDKNPPWDAKFLVTIQLLNYIKDKVSDDDEMAPPLPLIIF